MHGQNCPHCIQQKSAHSLVHSSVQQLGMASQTQVSQPQAPQPDWSRGAQPRGTQRPAAHVCQSSQLPQEVPQPSSPHSRCAHVQAMHLSPTSEQRVPGGQSPQDPPQPSPHGPQTAPWQLGTHAGDEHWLPHSSQCSAQLTSHAIEQQKESWLQTHSSQPHDAHPWDVPGSQPSGCSAQRPPAVQTLPGAQDPQVPPQPSGPHCFVLQSGEQQAPWPEHTAPAGHDPHDPPHPSPPQVLPSQ